MWMFGILEILMFFAVIDWSVGDKSCYKQLKSFGYIPEYANCVRSTDLIVEYDSVRFKCGKTLNILDAKNSPTVKYDFGRACKNVTLLVIGPNFILSPFVFYVVYNIPAETFRRGFKGKSEENPLDNKSSYQGDYGAKYLIPDYVAGIAGTENQTLVYFAYCQCREIFRDEMRDFRIRTNRAFYDPKTFADKYNLRNPVMLYHNFLAAGAALPNLVNATVPN